MEEFKVITEGTVNIDIPKLCRELNSRSKRRFVPGESIEFPEATYDKFKRQYSSDAIIDFLPSHTVLLSGEDLYGKNLSFVIGMSFEDKVIINVNRLFSDNNHVLSFERIMKEVLHQLGYLSGLNRCKDGRCIMAPSATPKLVDKKGINVCQSCTMRLAEKNERV